MLRLLVCDGSAGAREAVRALLAGHDELEVVGEAERLMDVSMPTASAGVASLPVEPLPSRVLLVDDDAPFRMLLRTTLEPADIEVDEAADAVEAAVRIAAHRPRRRSIPAARRPEPRVRLPAARRGKQFDQRVVHAFMRREPALRQIREQLAA